MSRSCFLLVLIAAIGILLASGEAATGGAKSKFAAVTPLDSDIVAVKRSLRTAEATTDDVKDLNLLIFGDSKSNSYNFKSNLANDEERAAFNFGGLMPKLNSAAQKFKSNPQVLKLTNQLKTATSNLQKNPTYIRVTGDIKAKAAQVKANPNVMKLQTELKVLQAKALNMPLVKDTLETFRKWKTATTKAQ
ncbi:hypothetical protein PHYBOEH_008638 [Phytophthora boehmeriae]|uniref:RxLR effector protein n=1 Tax=Phytophthora boehmeriae TaxID=109152 RepID=A0A8T1VZ43_9STRA|nr:hypothetical protein PHYBOEH_008638 [Phytophthora boehmeriae]